MLPPAWILKVSYSTLKDQDRGRVKSYDGFLHLWTSKDWIVLINAKGMGVVGRFMENGEYIDVGSEVIFSSHVVKIVECTKSSSSVVDEVLEPVCSGSEVVIADPSGGV